jgi:hypothetical protein
VLVEDKTSPVISPIIVDKPVLRPADGALVSVRLLYLAVDNCGTAKCEIAEISSNEPINGPGTPNPDWIIVSKHEVRLRAIVTGTGPRIYQITVRCTDSTGHASARAVRVEVPATVR